MEEIKKHQPGTFSLVDLAMTDLNAAKKFYSELFGLEAFAILKMEPMEE